MSEHKTPQKAAPIVKWAGGKRQLQNEILKVIEPLFDREKGTYFEPFFGGGAIFYALAPKKAYITDINEGLINLHIDVRDNLESLRSKLSKVESQYNELKNLEEKQDFYLRERAIFNSEQRKGLEQSARFIFLNKAGFNGMYRENAKGGFNIPFGKRTTLNLSSEGNLDLVSQALQAVDISCRPFLAIESQVRAGDLVYFDPPYVPLDDKNSFTGYHHTGFGMKEQEDLRDLCDRLVVKGATVVVSNSSSTELNRLYASGYEIVELMASRAISASAKGRAKVAEFLIWKKL